MSLTVIMHFYNEAYLLPWWLSHHRDLCDHGILIDYDSTDRSVALCREIAPEWEVRRSRNRDFQAGQVDAEVMDIERGLSGWKVALTTTEFLLSSRPLSQILSTEMLTGLRLKPVGLVDPPCLVDVEPSSDVPLLRQRTWGYSGSDPAGTHGRLLHSYECGRYHLGRHNFDIAVEPTEEIAVAWLEYAPMTPRGRARKMQIGARIPNHDRQLNLGCHHYRENAIEQSLQEKYALRVPFTRDLILDPWYAAMLARLPEKIICLS